MPELPEVELIVRGLNDEVVGRRVRSARVFWPGYVEGVAAEGLQSLLEGQRFGAGRRRGKFILITFDRTAALLHLRMTGNIRLLGDGDRPHPHTHVLLGLDDGRMLAFSDTRKFGRLRFFPLEEAEQRIEGLGLGLEPLEKEFNAGALARLLRGGRRAVKAWLLDQCGVAGIGNIYAGEILHAARIDPRRPTGSLAKAEISRLAAATRAVLRRAIERGGSSISDYRRVDGSGGDMQNHFRVYDRQSQRCRRCGAAIMRDVIGGRSTYWCGGCQT